jgi:UDP-glucose:(heptosyl)LPS alpha-1,3-glucosyltransferase
VKIAIVIERFEAWRGGAETSTLELARLLKARGHSIHVVTTTTAPSSPDITLHRVSAPTLLRPLRTAAFIRKATTFLQRNAFDIVHAISPLPCADVYQPRGGLLAETLERNVATRPSAPRRMLKQAMMAMNVKQRSLSDLEGAVFREQGPLIVAVSQYVARQCEQIYDVTSPRVRVVFNGVNPPHVPADERTLQRATLRKQYHVADGTLLMLFIAHNFRLKGLSPLIETAAHLVKSGFSNFKLLVVGRDNPVGYQRRINELSLGRFVTFTGPTQRVVSYYFAADALVHPTYYDPCSRVVLEALFFGLPCITTSFNGASEVITDGKNGFVVDRPDHVELWCRRIRELEDPEHRRRISEQASALRPRISMVRHAEQLDAIFSELLTAKTLQSRSA